MKVQNLIEMMKTKALDAEFRDAVFAYYQKDCREGITDAAEADYEAAKSRFAIILSPEQKDTLVEIEKLYSESRDHAACRGFQCGLYGGFRQYFTDTCDNDGGFYNLVCTGEERDYKERERKARCRELGDMLEKQLPENEKPHLVSIDCAWLERIHNASLHGFYCGYSAAYSVVDNVTPLARIKNISKILTTEYYLGYIRPYSAIEQIVAP